MLTTELVTAQWGLVGAGPQAHQALLVAVLALLQTPFCLAEIILVQGLWLQLVRLVRLPGLQSESPLTVPAETEKGKGRCWAGHVLE